MLQTLQKLIKRRSNDILECDFNVQKTCLWIFILSYFCPEVNTDDPEYSDVMKKITEIVGIPKNYGVSPEEQKEEDRKKERERKQRQAAVAAERKCKNEAALAEMAAQYEEWVS